MAWAFWAFIFALRFASLFFDMVDLASRSKNPIMRDDILECSVLLPESTRDYSQSNKAELAIQCKSAFVCSDNSVELKDAESESFCPTHGVADKRLPNVMPSPF